MTVKLAQLLASYLYTNKRLDLPGLGTFLLDPMAMDVTENKSGRTANMAGVSFENKPAVHEAPDLVQYITTQTGKIKALAAADLESHLGLAQQFLNIGKPFLFEGIGSLVKMRSGEFAFTSGHIMPDAMKVYTANEISTTPTSEDSFKSVFLLRKNKQDWKKPFVFFLVLTGIGLAIWGGYTVYKRSSSKNTPTNTDEPKKTTTPPVIQDTVHYQRDSAITPSETSAIPDRKFVLETAHEERAVARFAKLKSYQWDLQMETRDSLNYTLFLMLPVSPADTSRVLDSLTRLYGKRAMIDL